MNVFWFLHANIDGINNRRIERIRPGSTGNSSANLFLSELTFEKPRIEIDRRYSIEERTENWFNRVQQDVSGFDSHTLSVTSSTGTVTIECTPANPYPALVIA